MKYFIAILALIATATASSQGVRVRGVGTSSCGEYLEMRAENNRSKNAILVSWAWGYMAGFNFEVKQPTTRDTPDEPSTLAYIDRYCRNQPIENVVAAASALIVDLGGKRNPR
jgi:hypothetical protein